MSRQRTIAGEVTKTFPKSVLVHLPEQDRTLFIPRSVILDGDTLSPGDTDLVVAEWFCEKEGIE